MKRIFIFLIVTGLFLYGCESVTNSEWDLDRIRILVDSTSVPPGDELLLRAIGLTSSGDTLAVDFVSWSVDPPESGVIIPDLENNEYAIFYAAKAENNAVIEAEEISGKRNTITVTIASTAENGCLHQGSILSDETWTPAFNPHVVVSDVIIDHPDGTTLTIEPGCLIRFEQGTGLIVGLQGAGALVAEGTEADSIVFTSNSGTPLPGDWDGITFSNNADSEKSIIKYATIEYGGNNQRGNIWIGQLACPGISDNRIGFSSSCGILARAACDVADNTFHDNDSGDICQ